MRSRSGSSTTVALDSFGQRELRAGARAAGISEQALLARSVRHYLEQLRERRDDPAMRVPRLELPAAADRVAIEVPLPPATHSALSREARAQGVGAGRLAEHALYVELAGTHVARNAAPDPAEPVAARNEPAGARGCAGEVSRLSRRPS